MNRTSIFLALTLIGCSADPDEKAEQKGGGSDNHSLACHAKYGQQALTEDLDFLMEQTYQLHPNLYELIDSTTLANQFEKFRTELRDSMTYLEFLRHIAVTQTMVGDITWSWGHAQAYLDWRNAHVPLFPLELEHRGGKLFVHADTMYSIPDNAELVSLNGETIEDYIAKNYELLPIEDHERALQREWLAIYFPQHHTNFWGQDSIYEIGLRTPDSTWNLVVKAGPKHVYDAELWAVPPVRLSYTDHEGEQVPVITITVMHDSYLKYTGFDLEAKLDSIFDLVHDSKRLVLDLRGAEWPAGENGDLLYSYLARGPFQYADTLISNMMIVDSTLDNLDAIQQPKANAFQGQVVTIMDEWCNRGKWLLFLNLIKRRYQLDTDKDNSDQLFGAIFSPHRKSVSASTTTIKLPNTQIRIHIPTVEILAGAELESEEDGRIVVKVLHKGDYSNVSINEILDHCHQFHRPPETN